MTAELAIALAKGLPASTLTTSPASLGVAHAIGLQAYSTRVAEIAIAKAFGLMADSQRWFALVDSASGSLLSIGSEELVPAEGQELIALASRPDLRVVTWDAATKTFVPRPPKEYVTLIDRIVERLEELDLGAELLAQVRDVLDEMIDPSLR
jgi:hypothetical protein